jgi:hypothetical protein
MFHGHSRKFARDLLIGWLFPSGHIGLQDLVKPVYQRHRSETRLEAEEFVRRLRGGGRSAPSAGFFDLLRRAANPPARSIGSSGTRTREQARPVHGSEGSLAGPDSYIR